MSVTSNELPSSFRVLTGIGSFFLVLFIVLMVSGSYHIVPPGHRGIRVSLGSVSLEHLPEGLAWKTPFFDQIIDVPIMQLKRDGVADSFSSDLQTIKVSFSVLYRVPER